MYSKKEVVILVYQFANVKTELPGPKSKEILERRLQVVPKGVSYGAPIFVDHAKGALVTDVDGNIFIDFVGTIGTVNVGHNHPKVVKALHEQVDQYIHTGFNVVMYEPYIKLAEKLAELSPGSHEKQVMFLNSGAEAVENAVKIARKYTKRQGIVSFYGGFHGRTLLTMTMTSKVKPYKYEFGPFAPEFYKAPYPNVYHRPNVMTEDEYSEYMLEQFRNFLIGEVAPETIAAVVMEPVQGEGGFIVPTKKFVQGVYEICKKHGILFVADEIQTGFGRTGHYFAMDHFDIVPDIITVSKSLGAGVPISGVIGRKEIMQQSASGELGGTYSGSPLGCSAALAVLDVFKEENLNQRAVEIGHKVMDRFQVFYEKFNFIGNIRGLGAMCAMEIVEDRETKKPNKELTAKIIAEANKRGLLLLSAGLKSNVIRLLMPLVITNEQLEEGLNIMEEAMEDVMESAVVSN
ncbi:4-aminobutyrate--2-oxoglutarate transaminase [Tepidibacillus marianensis]|uniref:4-aminobutyrate--2-oxoglutarate transaminase n=1 Tax=Tepidibacillus marianensis TaxID=3131995 RepID=UPI00386F860F